MQYLRARYYDSNNRRFMSQDTVWGTIETPLSQALFIYVQNNPLNYTDPSGHMAQNMSGGDGGKYINETAQFADATAKRNSMNGSSSNSTQEQIKNAGSNSERAQCQENDGFWKSIGSWFGNTFGAEASVIGKYNLFPEYQIDLFLLKYGVTGEIINNISSAGSANKPISVYAEGNSAFWLSSSAGLIINFDSEHRMQLNLALDDISLSTEWNDSDNETSGYEIALSPVNFEAKFSSVKTSTNDKIDTVTKTGVTIDLFFILAALGLAKSGVLSSPPASGNPIPQPNY